MIIEMLNYKEFEKAKALLEQHGFTFEVYSNATDCYIAQEIDFHLDMYADNTEIELSDEVRQLVHQGIHLKEPLAYEAMQELVNTFMERCLRVVQTTC